MNLINCPSFTSPKVNTLCPHKHSILSQSNVKRDYDVLALNQRKSSLSKISSKSSRPQAIQKSQQSTTEPVVKKRLVLAMIFTTLLMIAYKVVHSGKNTISITKILLFINSLIINDLSLRYVTQTQISLSDICWSFKT